MGIRTRGFTKSSQKSGDQGGECVVSKVSPVKEEILEEENRKESDQPKVVVKSEEKLVPGSPVQSCASRPRVTFQRSPLKLRTPMARLGGIKAAARKLKKHRKRNLIVQSATKILRSSIKSNKTRRPCRPEEKPRTNGVTLPSRVSARTLIRRSSREGIPEMPLRTVELIKRPLELREPATKLLYMASLGLYPRTGDSDMTPIVVIKELNCSPGKKNGVRKSLELPLIPVHFHKRIMDQEKQLMSENIKPGGKQPKRENRKTPPVEKSVPSESKVVDKKPTSGRKTPVTAPSPPAPQPEEAIKPSLNYTSEDCSISISLQHKPVKKVKTSPLASPKLNGLVNTTIVPVVVPKQNSAWSITPVPSKTTSPLLTEINKLSPNSSSPKSLLKSNISPPSSFTKDTTVSVSAPLNLTSSLPLKLETSKSQSTESLLSSACSVQQAMNLFMSNITIIPSNNPVNPRKRSADDSSENSGARNFSLHSMAIPAVTEKKPPKKKQKNASGEKKGRFSLPTSVSNVVNNINSSINISNLFQQTANADEALNLCMKRPAPEVLPNPPVQILPKLQLNSNINIQKAGKNGTKPLNLIIPRPPPLMKAPLEAANFANCTQNIQPLLPLPTKAKTQQKKPKKSRQNININNNQLNQSNLQIQDSLPALPTLPLVPSVDTTVHAKSLLKCMNGGEENTCAREIGESLDSVKTMLSRLQTRIGPAVNGVRLITIE